MFSVDGEYIQRQKQQLLLLPPPPKWQPRKVLQVDFRSSQQHATKLHIQSLQLYNHNLLQHFKHRQLPTPTRPLQSKILHDHHRGGILISIHNWSPWQQFGRLHRRQEQRDAQPNVHFHRQSRPIRHRLVFVGGSIHATQWHLKVVGVW